MSEDKTEYIFYTSDPQDNTVYLSSEKWDFLTSKHPELHGEEAEIKETVEKPDSIYNDKEYQHTFCYYREHKSDYLRIYGPYVKVVVDRDSLGEVKTTYFTDRSRETSEPIYEKPIIPKKDDED